MPHSEGFPDRLKKYRKSNGWTQKQLAKRWHVSPETISAWERRRRRPDVQLVPTLASELVMDRGELIEYISASSVKSKEGINRETDPDELEPKGLFVEFQNQDSCELYIRKEALHATKIRVLTIRGDKFFVGTNSLFHDVVEERRSTIEVLVLSPESEHITEELARKLQKNSAEDIRRGMHRSLDFLKDRARWYENFNVKCYNEEPNFKLLIFDDVMFVSSFAREVPKNDQNAEMFMIRAGNALFAGFEKLFDELSRRSVPPD